MNSLWNRVYEPRGNMPVGKRDYELVKQANALLMNNLIKQPLFIVCFESYFSYSQLFNHFDLFIELILTNV
jgi:hypothetical protein